MNPAHLSLRPGPVRRSSDQALARMAASGSEAAFGELVARHERALRVYAQTIVRQRQDAEDVAQTTFLKALRALRAGTRPGQVKAWLFRIAHNEAVSLLRARREQAALPEESSAGHPSTGSAHDRLVEAEDLRTLVADVGTLPERQRTALVLHELCGMRYGDVAAVLDTDPDNARLLAFQARGSLKESELGRELPCEVVREAWRDGGGRALRRRSLRAHVDACGPCADYVASHRRRRGLVGWLGGLGVLWPLAGSGGAGVAAGGLAGTTAKVAGVALTIAGTVGALEVHPASHPRSGRPASASAMATPLTPAAHVKTRAAPSTVLSVATNAPTATLRPAAAGVPSRVVTALSDIASAAPRRVSHTPDGTGAAPARAAGWPSRGSQPATASMGAARPSASAPPQNRTPWSAGSQSDTTPAAPATSNSGQPSATSGASHPWASPASGGGRREQADGSQARTFFSAGAGQTQGAPASVPTDRPDSRTQPVLGATSHQDAAPPAHG